MSEKSRGNNDPNIRPPNNDRVTYDIRDFNDRRDDRRGNDDRRDFNDRRGNDDRRDFNDRRGNDDRSNFRDDRRPSNDNRSNFRDDRRPSNDNRSNFRDDRSNFRDDRRPSNDNRSNFRDDRKPSNDNRSNFRDDRRPSNDDRRPSNDNRRPLENSLVNPVIKAQVIPLPKAQVIPLPKAQVIPSKKKNRCAFAIIHFGNNPVYLELELYFFKMLRQYSANDIIYLYSVNDTPASFIEAVMPFVTDVVPYDDKGITYDVTFKSEYSNFNTLRTCNFIFAYTLEQYDTVCIIESDMVIMGNIDAIFNLRSPAILTYYIGDRRLKFNDEVRNNPSEVLAKCKDMGRINGGVMLINPSQKLFESYKSKIVDVVRNECKYPNETLFEYVNNLYYNLPVQYNLSHYHAKLYRLQKKSYN